MLLLHFFFKVISKRLLHLCPSLNLFSSLPSCRSPSEFPTKRWNARVMMTRAVWATMSCLGVCTGLGADFPFGTITRKNCWVHQRPNGSASTWTSMQGFWPFTASPKTRLPSSTDTSSSSLALCSQDSDSGQE